ncbi:MAG: hypothetical protein Q9224_004157 [Gallowayella concinna]
MTSAARQGRRRTYQEDFEAATQEIHKAIQRGLPSAAPDYDTIAVLMIHWDNDNLGVQPLEHALAEVFKTTYHFNVETYVMQAYAKTSALHRMHSRLINFAAKYQGPKSLFIYVYSGHADSGPYPPGDQCLWFGDSADPNSPRLDWLKCRHVAEGAQADKLFLFDCCYASTAALNNFGYEYLVAASMEAQAAGNLQGSFTQRLINILQQHARGGIAVSQIHALMVKTMRQGGTTLDATPVHIGASPKSSIVLKPIVTVTREVHGLRKAVTRGAGKVLVTLRLRGAGTVPDVREWQRWLSRSIPDEVESVAVEAVFPGSTIILLTLPMEVWTFLDGTPGFQFVDYVDDHNQWVQSESQQLGIGGLSLSDRPKGLENQPFASSSKGGFR